ncbi:MAG: tetratricopeptide repeat protein [Sandaracinaceae bacterium]
MSFGKLFERLDRREDAVAAYQRIGEVDPDHAPAMARLGENLMELRRFAEAVEPYQQAMLSAPDDPMLRYGLGICYANLGQDAAAAKQLDVLKKLDPDLAEELQWVIE